MTLVCGWKSFLRNQLDVTTMESGKVQKYFLSCGFLKSFVSAWTMVCIWQRKYHVKPVCCLGKDSPHRGIFLYESISNSVTASPEAPCALLGPPAGLPETNKQMKLAHSYTANVQKVSTLGHHGFSCSLLQAESLFELSVAV